MGDVTVRILPVYHDKITFAKIAADTITSFDPDVIAIELPADLKEIFTTAVKRLPVLSIVGYIERNREPMAETGATTPAGVDGMPAVTLGSAYSFLPVHPGDPMVEAIRLGMERNKQIEFIDLVLDNYDPVEYALPDEESLEYVPNLAAFQNLVMGHLPKSGKGSVDYDRELCMASRVMDLAQEGKKVLCIAGFAHCARIQEFIEAKARVDVADPATHKYQQIFNVAPVSSDLVIDEIPYIEYLYELSREIRARNEQLQSIVDRVAAAKFDFFKASERFFQHGPGSNNEEASSGTGDTTGTNIPIEEAIDDRWIEVLKHVTRVEVDALEREPYSRKAALSLLYATTNIIYEEYYFRDPVPALKSRSMMQYLRNWAAIRERLFPGLDQVALTAKNFVNEEYASILLDIARMYPFIDTLDEYPAVYHDARFQLLGPNSILFKNRHSSRHRSWIQLPIKRRPMQRYPGEWRDAWDNRSLGLCSFPPEDKVEEDFFNSMRIKTIQILEEKHVKIHEFKDSLMDGVEFRETLRKKLLGKLYVKEIIPVIGKAGSVVIVFDPDENKHRYENKISWWAEHNQESDMAFYATFPEENLIGPGIARIELGGLVSIFPPRHVPDIWRFYNENVTSLKKHEILVLAAMDFSEEKYIPYVAANPPSRRMERLAADRNKVLVHIPIWKLSGETLDRVRFIHVLGGKAVRAYAKDYIFL
nr:hypothetical protein [Candidatus Sigynarchaeum springense]MDO8119296.1 hypothetical protein [Candidatus Sigynarchaeota archaeon]